LKSIDKDIKRARKLSKSAERKARRQAFLKRVSSSERKKSSSKRVPMTRARKARKVKVS